ncbi:MAG: hypothetical protein D6701_02765 [Gemmatimonadetes bacterium]|nr:MAG: hypothetical protein D6701_02765 [Gemmatimonadota bacterium]
MDGLIQLIAVAMFVIFAILENQQRRKGGGRRGRPPGGGGPDTTPGRARLPGPQEDEAADDLLTSEGMIPADVWDEIEALARGRAGPGASAERSGPPARVEPSPSPSPAEAARWYYDEEDGAEEAAQAGEVVELDAYRVGVPGEEAPRVTRRRAAQPPRRGGPGALVRALRSSGRDELRRAVVLAEVLGPPRADQPDP